jgi:tetratricopeptide (TPR) repeat protein
VIRPAHELMRAGDWAGALVLIRRALSQHPGNPSLLIDQARCQMALGQQKAACDGAAVAEAQAPQDAPIADAAASIYSAAGNQIRALASYDRAVALRPSVVAFLYNRATVRRFLGLLREAEADYDRVIELRPDEFEAYKNRSDLRRQGVSDNHVAELESLAAKGFPHWTAEMQIRYALAKEYEDLGEYERSFSQLTIGASLRRRHMQYNVLSDVATAEWIMETFASAAPPVSTGCAVDAPIFIVGLPRSGTTLLDRILGSHSQVTSAGELNAMAEAIVDAAKSESAVRLTRRDLIACSAHLDFAALGHDYLRRATEPLPGVARFTDKMPLNHLYCGLIRRALPNAKIIHLTRHPMALGYAMYKTLFKDGYPYSYDLRDIGQYYVAYRKLMTFWEQEMPGGFLRVRYEDVVSDQKEQTRRILEFCGLNWDDACLQFHNNASPSTTASAAQVRQPIYDSSLTQWRHYEKQLQPLREVIEAAQIEI